MGVLLTGMSGAGKSATAPRSALADRLRTRTGNRYGQAEDELAQVLADVDEVEPLLRRSADLVLTTTAPLPELADRLLRRVDPP